MKFSLGDLVYDAVTKSYGVITGINIVHIMKDEACPMTWDFELLVNGSKYYADVDDIQKVENV